MKGFKAGALNYVLSQTAPDAEVIGVSTATTWCGPTG